MLKSLNSCCKTTVFYIQNDTLYNENRKNKLIFKNDLNKEERFYSITRNGAKCFGLCRESSLPWVMQRHTVIGV